MCVAENSSMEEMLKARFKEVSIALLDKPPLSALPQFRGDSGRHVLQRVVPLQRAIHAVDHFLAPPVDGMVGVGVTADDAIAITNGCGPAMNLISFCLGDGDGTDCFLTTKPLYPVFLLDCEKEAGVRVVPSVKTSMETSFEITRSALEQGYESSVAEGLKPKALLTVNPGNPSGRVATADELRTIRNWCGEKGIWWISDEIYGCAVHDDSERPHISALNLPLLPGDLDPPTLVLWGLSKDLGLSGMRVGFCLGLPRQRHDPSVVTLKKAAQSSYNMFAAVSPLTQWFTEKLLGDQHWMTAYLSEYRKVLTECKKLICQGLEGLGIPFYQPDGSIFIWADFSEFLTPDDSRGDSNALFDKLCDEPYKIIPSPGDSFFGPPGGMRFCYMWMAKPQQACQELVRRLSVFVACNRRK
ncbi:1-aminocyclopropane-1-carboxylate synthase CMA101, putative [Perkinsus marinus ATCC 50983]|uniref:1-aminocyclopropane-1-carboxylate synthase CMA101, putative n=1 Tax=Perkinsus marinus (strain ATCC 50983 / TXsc) TaxID=423536 RepID=C5L711_PERM5|nr:1-aminocyclopropane-1-carboxylate synthase CMA101, putative [Perkinsus marinus ATCC 50983]EER07273.1 1-aminocyclopropane-1-carboxylate synthase CMA101, putative [Perkinsus marinus ATCC 50983]|eukprot:XP_002775457.1 1-aminocyclopropane-1-carboxylate synthase CMA101, putative [Perkinsus marinus ATCC 50983]